MVLDAKTTNRMRAAMDSTGYLPNFDTTCALLDTVYALRAEVVKLKSDNERLTAFRNEIMREALDGPPEVERRVKP